MPSLLGLLILLVVFIKMYDYEEVHISNIGVGDVIFHEEKWKTVSKNNIKNCVFMGTTIFGYCYKLGYKPVKRAILRR